MDSNLAALRRAPGVDPAPRVEVRSRTSAAEPAAAQQSGAVQVSLSREAVKALARADGQKDSAASLAGDDSLAPGELSESDQELVRKLEARDAEVRTHEQAHISAGGRHVNGGPSYEYQTGPNGRRYAIGGSVNIDTSPVPNDPEATIDKARVVERAALAPAEPSSTDRQVASAARKMGAAARAELAEKKAEELAESDDTASAEARQKGGDAADASANEQVAAEAGAGARAAGPDPRTRRPGTPRGRPPAFDVASGRASARAFDRAATSPFRDTGDGANAEASTNPGATPETGSTPSEAIAGAVLPLAGETDSGVVPRFRFRQAARAYAARNR